MGMDIKNNISFTLLQNIRKWWRYIGFIKSWHIKYLEKTKKDEFRKLGRTCTCFSGW